MKIWTVSDIMKQEPCWTSEEVQAVFDEQNTETLTTEQILRLEIDAQTRSGSQHVQGQSPWTCCGSSLISPRIGPCGIMC